MVFFLGIPFSSSSTQEELPRAGFVKNDGANVRAGDNINFESLCRLEKNDPVKITGKRYSWFEIMLPEKAHLYIKSDYVTFGPGQKGIGLVNALRVNLRSGPDTKYPVVGQVSNPEKINVLEEQDDWYKIIPPKGTTGWIHSSQLSFRLEEIGYASAQKNAQLTPDQAKSQDNLTSSAQNNQ